LTLFSIHHFFYLILGVVVGLTIGILPGLGGIAGMSLILPFIFGREPASALAMMIGLTSVTATSDTFPSVLMGIPGTSASQATVVDGFPLAKKGEGARALGAAFSASLFGGVFGAVILTGAVFAARPIILAIGFGEQLMLVVLALSMVSMLTGTSALKGLAACGMGLLIGTIGAAPATAEVRLGFETIYLSDGVPLVIIGLGMFALPEIIDVLRHRRTISESGSLGTGWIEGLRDTIRHRWIVLRCAAIGCLVGALPGLGGTVVDWIAYSHVVQTSRDKENFGKGDIRGVLAPESANNAKEGGALIPTLLFGIPGSGSMALLLGGLVMIGLEPGPEMVEANLDLTFLIIWSIGLANIFGSGICFALAQPIAKLTTIRYNLIAPFMLTIVFFAAYQASQDWGDLLSLFALGTLGIFMKRFDWSRPALLIGFVLSDKVEAAFYQTLQVYGFTFLRRPIVIFLLIVTIVSIYFAIRGRAGNRQISTPASPDKKPQIIFWALLLLFPLAIFIDAGRLTFLGGFYPKAIAAATFGLLLVVGANLFLRRKPHAMIYDEEYLKPEEARPEYSNLHYIGWLAALLAGTALIGFVLAVVAFVFIFLRVRAHTSYLVSTFGAAAVLLILGVLGAALVLEFQHGLLQNYVPLPWPFL
jgi:TctA family transporter/uncharacterized membrane protein